VPLPDVAAPSGTLNAGAVLAAGVYFVRYAQEAAWREDHRAISNGDQAYGVIGLAMGLGPSIDFGGYWQRAKTA